MKNVLLFDFQVDKEKCKIFITKELQASLPLAWRVWTEPSYLDQWWAPLPFKNETISMQFEESGTWFYAMISPEGDKHYCKANYQKIESLQHFSYKDAFCDENGVDISAMPSMQWKINFTEESASTKVAIVVDFTSEEALENIIKMGFREGFGMAIAQLDNLLLNINL